MTNQHVMTCPLCQGTLREVIRENISIDVCGQCRGVWLDRGELEKLLASARQEAMAEANRYESRAQYENNRNEDRYASDPKRYDRDQRHHGHGHYRKKSKFESIFDIFD